MLVLLLIEFHFQYKLTPNYLPHGPGPLGARISLGLLKKSQQDMKAHHLENQVRNMPRREEFFLFQRNNHTFEVFQFLLDV